MKIEKIEVVFARPVELTDAEQRAIASIVSDAARRTETPEFVHWAAGTGCKPNWSKRDCAIFGYAESPNSPETGEPTWDDTVFYIETATRERYDTEPFKSYAPPITNATRFAELFEAIVARCSTQDADPTTDELRKLYVFADRIRKGQL